MRDSSNGIEVSDLLTNKQFANRQPRAHDVNLQSECMKRIAATLVDHPENILQQLVDSSLKLCGADSAGVSIERLSERGEIEYHWVATAGEYGQYLDALLPSTPSACGVCLEQNRPQLLRVTSAFFELMKIKAPVVTDGLLLPWKSGQTRGTIWVLAHTRAEAFDPQDFSLMQVLATYASFGILQQQRQNAQHKVWAATAAAAVTGVLAQRVHVPLKKLTDLVFIGANSKSGSDAAALARNLEEPLQVLTRIIEEVAGRPVAHWPN